MALKQDKFNFFLAVVAEKRLVKCPDKTVPLRLNSERKIGFFSGHSCL